MKLLLTLLIVSLCCPSCELMFGETVPKISPADPALQKLTGARVRLKDDWWGKAVPYPADLGAPYLLYVGKPQNPGEVDVRKGTLVTVVEFRNVADATSGSIAHVILEIPARGAAAPVRVAMMLNPGDLADAANIPRAVSNHQTPTQNLAQGLAPRNNVIWRRVD
jgi:hypothetical protein